MYFFKANKPESLTVKKIWTKAFSGSDLENFCRHPPTPLPFQLLALIIALPLRKIIVRTSRETNVEIFATCLSDKKGGERRKGGRRGTFDQVTSIPLPFFAPYVCHPSTDRGGKKIVSGDLEMVHRCRLSILIYRKVITALKTSLFPFHNFASNWIWTLGYPNVDSSMIRWVFEFLGRGIDISVSFLFSGFVII